LTAFTEIVTGLAEPVLFKASELELIAGPSRPVPSTSVQDIREA